ncbi:unnamed protein product [Calypogeia fissa]
MVELQTKAELEHDSGSEEDDAPEEVTLSSGREKAQELRKEERENQKRIQAEAKQRRQRNIVKKKEESQSDKQEDAPVAESVEEAGVNPAQDDHEFKLSKPGKISGFLDTSIIDFLAAQEKKVVEASASPPEDESLQPRKRVGKRKGNKEIISSSRVKVVLLESDRPSSANYQNALEFKQKRLQGERVHRSLDMLRAKR